MQKNFLHKAENTLNWNEFLDITIVKTINITITTCSAK